MENITQIKKIEAFLQNSMSAEEAAEFKLEIANDPGLARLVEEFKITFQGLQHQWISKGVTAAAKSMHFLHLLKIALISFAGAAVVGVLVFNATRNNKNDSNPTIIKTTSDSTISINSANNQCFDNKSANSDSTQSCENKMPYALISEYASKQHTAQQTADQLYKSYRNKLTPDTQFFTISNLRDTIIIGNSGMKIEIPANSLWSYEKQNPIESKVEIRLTEFMDYFSMYKANVSTMANGHILNSGGSCYITAIAPNDSVLLAPGKQLKLSFPCDTINELMTTFYGNKNEQGTVVWGNTESAKGEILQIRYRLLDGNTPVTYDTLYFIKTYKKNSTTTGRALYSHLYENKRFNKSETYFSDTKSHKKWGEYILQPVRRYGPASKTSKMMHNIIYANIFGFINCDHFLKSKQLEQVTLVNTDTILESYMFFKNSNSCMPAYLNVFYNIPHHSEVMIVAIMRRNNKLLMSFTSTQTSTVINLNDGTPLIASVIEKTIKEFDKK